MEEKVLDGKKNGMAVLVLSILLYLAAILGVFLGGINGIPVLVVISIVWLCIGWIFWPGLKVLKPQEALVLTLFGKYIGTLKGAGFYFVNPFSSAVNPAAKTRLNQSGDVDDGASKLAMRAPSSGDGANNKVSLKIMTLNNARQKINDCLGNPVEIGIAVMWRVADTAKAVFNVDNYKEYLSLQCDSALRNIVRRTWTRPATAWPTKAACAAPARSLHSAYATRSSRRCPRPDWRSSRPASPTWPTPRRSRRSCSSVSRRAP